METFECECLSIETYCNLETNSKMRCQTASFNVRKYLKGVCGIESLTW